MTPLRGDVRSCHSSCGSLVFMVDQSPPPPWQPAPTQQGWRGWSRNKKLAVGGGVTLLVLLVIGALAGPRRDAPGPTATPLVAVTASPFQSSTTAPTVTATVASPASPGVVYTIDIEAEAVGRAAVRLIGTTNLPDGSVISLSGTRAHHDRGEGDIRGAPAARDDVTVTAGAFSGTLALDESVLLIFVGTTPVDDVIDIIDRDLTVCAEFQTGTDIDGLQRQPESVVAIVGPNGEAVAGSPQAILFGSATDHPSHWLEAVIDVPIESPVLAELTQKQGEAPEQVEMDGFCL